MKRKDLVVGKLYVTGNKDFGPFKYGGTERNDFTGGCYQIVKILSTEFHHRASYGGDIQQGKGGEGYVTGVLVEIMQGTYPDGKTWGSDNEMIGAKPSLRRGEPALEVVTLRSIAMPFFSYVDAMKRKVHQKKKADVDAEIAREDRVSRLAVARGKIGDLLSNNARGTLFQELGNAWHLEALEEISDVLQRQQDALVAARKELASHHIVTPDETGTLSLLDSVIVELRDTPNPSKAVR